MPEPTLAAAFTTLQGDVARFLGYSRTAADWDTEQAADIEQCIKGGLRRFYYCGTAWSFLRPVQTVTLAEGDATVLLPDDFGGVQGPLTISLASGAALYTPLPVGPIGTVYDLEARFPDQTGAPQYACVEPLKGTSLTRSTRWQVHVFPAAEQDHTLQFLMNVNPNYLDGSHPYAYGGPQHAETLLSACKATAELDRDDQQGPQFAEFLRLLEISKTLDSATKPQRLGYNGDPTCRGQRSGWDWRAEQHWSDTGVVTVGGVTPE